ncbi:soluble lytic murein transglycosylase [Campylobacter blaseri]|uniref:Transglycosylase SLT domain-containing protein n=1 Tax=Campylobacter blaseri TaxID=2042961 RepID=A0A2P8QZZ4_9BACT|nr:lytic transglycosylase domain-containing protein [Campylobacter blaseri]PSM51814.1 hypothetical protein CQ405_06715 [Campylobacter blaseri]PSM53605.1 hypothetical protein CRN67_06720 [Campylobacter blaseri]QKF86416.1 soluble lytic murein transglycosylase [Campylobacter blaseri]
MLLKCNFLLIFFTIFVNAGVLSYEELKNKPRSLAKDYYIYRLLTETKYDKKEIKELSKDVYRNKGKLERKLSAIVTQSKKIDPCKGVNAKNILDANLTCKLNRMWPNFVKYISKENRQKLIKELSSYADYVNLLNGYDRENPAKYYADTKHVKNFFSYYMSLNKSEQNSKFDFKLEKEFANNLSNYWYFKTFIKDAVVYDRHKTLRSSLLDINSSNFSQDEAFFLGLNAIKLNKDDSAVAFFDQAAKTYKYQFDRDKSIFWSYLITKNSKTLDNLAKSNDINIYSLYAKEKTGLNKIDVVIPTPSKKNIKDYNIKDPFEWVRLQIKVKNADNETLKSLAIKFNTQETMGQYIYIMNKLSGYNDNFYPMPFMEYIKDSTTHRKALILAIARQESRFIPSVVSTSYALGLMQFMPFVANDWAKKKGLKIYDQDDMFDPKIAYEFANMHLDWLEKYLYNPVFIAYAYNGGIGFTKRMLLKGDLFNEGKYEPFLSMELVPYTESREYAKKVLANYIIYYQALSPGSNTSILKLFETLTQPSKSDSYRKQ